MRTVVPSAVLAQRWPCDFLCYSCNRVWGVPKPLASNIRACIKTPLGAFAGQYRGYFVGTRVFSWSNRCRTTLSGSNNTVSNVWPSDDKVMLFVGFRELKRLSHFR
jgi:hypothetical protein